MGPFTDSPAPTTMRAMNSWTKLPAKPQATVARLQMVMPMERIQVRRHRSMSGESGMPNTT